MLIRTVVSTFRSVPRAILPHTEVRLCCRRRVGCALPARAPTARLFVRPVGHPRRRAVARPNHCGANQHKRRNPPQPRFRFGQTHVMLICLDKLRTTIKGETAGCCCWNAGRSRLRRGGVMNTPAHPRLLKPRPLHTTIAEHALLPFTLRC